MAAQKTYSWSDSEDRVLSVVSEVEKLHQSGLHTDCVLVGGGASIRCHSVMLASVSQVFRDILPQPGADQEDTVIVLADWGKEEVSSAVNMLYSGALCYRSGARDRVGRMAVLLESIGIKGFTQEVLEVEDLQTNDNNGFMIMDIRTIPTDEVKTESLKEDCDQTELRISGVTTDVLNSNFPQLQQCFRCGGELPSLAEYKSHLEHHIEDTRNCISKLMEKVKEGDKTTDWMCESCYINLLSDQQKEELNEETCWNILNKHRKACTEEVELEIRRIDQTMVDSTSNQDSDDGLPTCDQCGKTFKLSIQLKKHKKGCSGVPRMHSKNSNSILDLLNANGWTQCPICKEKEAEDIDFHMITHFNVRTHLEAETPEVSEYRCGDTKCLTEKDQLSWTHDLRLLFIMHKYKNCKYSARSNLEGVLNKVTLEDLNVLEESGLSDASEEKSIASLMEDCYSGEKNNPNFEVQNKKCEEIGAEINQIIRRRESSRSGRSSSGEEAVQKKYEDPDISSLKCNQCLRSFRDAREKSNINKHFCVLVGNLSEPLLEEMNPTSSMLVTHKCTICIGGPVLLNDLEYKKHLCLAHKGIFMVTNLKKEGLETGVGTCFLCNRQLTGWEDAVLHVGLEHEKLFQGLKHDMNNDYKILLKRFYPEKFKKWDKKQNKKTKSSDIETSVDTSQSTMDVNLSMVTHADLSVPALARKRRLEVDQNELELTIKLPRATASDSTGASEEEATSTPKSPGRCQCKGCLRPDCKKCKYCQDRAVYGGEGKLRKRCEKRTCQGQQAKGKGKPGASKERIACWICPKLSKASHSNETELKKHMADVHFSESILEHYPHPTSATSLSFPCNFPNCTSTLNTEVARVKHLGVVHKQVDRCLATPKLVDEAKSRAGKGQTRAKRSVSTDSDSISCKTCGTNFPTKEKLRLHSCHSLLDKNDQDCISEPPRIRHTSKKIVPENPKETHCQKVPDFVEVSDLVPDTLLQNFSSASSVSAEAESNETPDHTAPLSSTTTPTKLQLILSDSDAEDNELPSEVGQIRRKLESLCSSESDTDDSDIDTDSEADNTLNTHDTTSDTSISGMVLKKIEGSVAPYSCEACQKICKDEAELKSHGECVNCKNKDQNILIESCKKHKTCEYCKQCFSMGVDVHVTCDAAKCKKCFNSEEEKTKHFHENHSWDAL